MIRDVNSNDKNEIKSLLEQLSSYPITIETIDIEKHINRISNLDHMKIIGFSENNKIIGMCTIGRIEGISKSGRPFAVIENVVVDLDHRSKGIGKKIINHAIAIAEKWNCYKAILETGSKAEWKLSFYEKCGLEKGRKTAFIKRFK